MALSVAFGTAAIPEIAAGAMPPVLAILAVANLGCAVIDLAAGFVFDKAVAACGGNCNVAGCALASVGCTDILAFPAGLGLDDALNVAAHGIYSAYGVPAMTLTRGCGGLGGGSRLLGAASGASAPAGQRSVVNLQQMGR